MWKYYSNSFVVEGVLRRWAVRVIKKDFDPTYSHRVMTHERNDVSQENAFWKLQQLYYRARKVTETA